MARDFRQGYSQQSKKGFQRKSQQVSEPETEASSKLVWMAATFLSVGLLGGYIVVNHFATQGVGSRIEAQETPSQLSAELAEKPQASPSSVLQSIAETSGSTLPTLEESSGSESQSFPGKPIKKVLEPIRLEAEDEASSGGEASAKLGASSPKSSREIEYSFYHGLSETEVIVEAEPISVALAVPHYILAGTFGSNAVAEKEQKRLKKMGQEVELTIIKQQKTYYRLRVGPFHDRLEMNKKRNELRRLGVDTMVMKSTPPKR